VDALDTPCRLGIILKDEIIDVCVGERRTLAVRYPERRGDRVVLFAHNADVRFRDVGVRPLL